MRSTSSPDSTTTTDPIVNSLMQELRSMKLTSGIDACSKSGDSGFLSSGDSSVNGDVCSSNASVIMRVNSGSSNSNNSGNNVWGNKTIWGASTTTTINNGSNDTNINFSSINNSKESIWSAQSPPLSGNSLWENNFNKQSNNAISNNNNNNNKNQDAEWLGSIWMIPQTPQTNNNNNGNNNSNKISSYSSKLNAIWDTPDSYQNFKSDLQQPGTAASSGEFQLLRPHDIGRNMWNNSTAAAVMNSVTKQESVSAIWAAPSPAPTPVQRPPPATLPQLQQNNSLRANPCIAPKSYPVMQQQPQLQQQQQHITNTNLNGIMTGNHQQMSMQNNCYSQLFSDDFLNNYLNIIN